MQTNDNKKKTKREKCIICGRLTKYDYDTPIDERLYYIEGVGQLCDKCYFDILIEKKELPDG